MIQLAVRLRALTLSALLAGRASGQAPDASRVVASCIPKDARRYSAQELAAFRKLALESLRQSRVSVARADWDARLDSIFSKLVQVSGMGEPRPLLAVTHDEALGARSVHGGVITINDGSLSFVERMARSEPEPTRRTRENELVAVLMAHELAHFTQGHLSFEPMEKLRPEIEFDGREMRALPAGVAAQRVQQQCEYDADRVGAFYVFLAGGRLSAASDLFQAAQSSGANKPPSDYAWMQLSSLTSTHPVWDERASAISSYMSRLQRHRGRYFDAEMLVRGNAHLDYAAARVDTILVDFPDLIAPLHLRGVIEHQRWLNTVPLEMQKVRGSLTTIGAESFPEIKGAPGDTAILARARYWYGQVLRRSPSIVAMSNLAVLEAYAGHLRTADSLVDQAEKALAANTMNREVRARLEAAVYNNGGVVAFLAGRLKDAMKRFERSTSESQQAAYNIAVTADSLSDPRAARLIREYLAADSSSDWADAMRKRLGRRDPVAAAALAPEPLPPPSVNGVTLGTPLELAEARLGPLGKPHDVASDFPERGIRLTHSPGGGVESIEVYGSFSGEILRLRIGQPFAVTKQVLGPRPESNPDGSSSWRLHGANWVVSVSGPQGTIEGITIRKLR